jgi:transposase
LYRDARIRSFIWEYAKALRLQNDGTHIIVYLDESYIHAAHQMKKGWHSTVGPYRNNETQGDADTGLRLIILHAMSKDGMLEVEDAVGSNFLHEVTPTAQFVFEAASFDHSDYHETMDGEMFTLWVKNRLLPAFHQLFPGKKMILVMDNATYHRPRDFDWITPYKMCKTACVTFLERHGVTEFTAERDGVEVTFNQAQFTQRASKKNAAPTVKELQKAVNTYLQQHPGINKTKIDKLLEPLGHSIVWTPPFVPEVQPIELIWAYVKQVVASQYSLNRTIATTRQQTDDAFDTITPEMIQKRIAHCHKWINDFLQTDDAGSLKTFSTLENLIAADSSTPQPTDIESTIIEEAEGEEEPIEDTE